ncbi:hypothetical protein G6F48_002324 [Rhizopus delemar]|nr:hypothetical protein G6F48_002324 [Rhizopus delemar]
MPIDSNSLQGPANHPLSSEEVDSLLSTFIEERKRLICPNCNQQDHFRRHDSTKSDPPHLLFRCVSCRKCFQATSMKHIIQDPCQGRPQLQTPTDMEQTRFSQETNHTHTPTISYSQNDLKTLLDTIQHLTQELQQARAEMDQICSQLDKIQQQILQQTQTVDPFPSLNRHPPYQNPEAMTQMTNIETAPWHEPAKYQEAAAHFLQPPSDSQGFPNLFTILRRLEFQLDRPQNLRDPKFAHLPLEERIHRAFMHPCDRMERAF